MQHAHSLGRLFLPLLASIVALTPLAVDLYLPAMVAIAEQLDTSLEKVQVSLSSYLAGYALGMLVFGPLADRFSRTLLARFGLFGFAISSALLAMSTNIETFNLLRIIQAFTGAAATVVIPGIIRHFYQQDTAKGMSYVSMIMMLAPLLAPSIGAALMLIWHWSAIFWCLTLYATAVLIFITFANIDVPRFSNDKISARFFFRNYQQVLSNKLCRMDLLTSMAASFAFFCFLTSVPFVYLDYFNVSEQLFGILFALNVMALMLGNFLNTRLVPKLGSRRVLYIGLFIGMIAGTALVIQSSLQVNVWIFASTIAPLMMSLGIIASNADALILIAFEQHTGTATAVIGTLRFGSGALVGPILAFIEPSTALPFACMMLSALVLCCIYQLLQKSGIKKAE
ncbi:Bcr/CflA family efflux MFS transporter [Pseudoalteromonas byunsanensis]|uniref:Bcr/CflA family efflux transporter n=1 Tax=Pseudoalteromonas byunsanensis TaxID=327939 RepID=A0A1S1N7K1_9GAMM|nr:Bcr/CflA family efflux MFS transporter [Pseudoalteromonas byunsanensis]OHU95987.1 Bcr/CflA family drug resistance efflux transporter [Pseudoalteromonas byunsanensis]